MTNTATYGSIRVKIERWEIYKKAPFKKGYNWLLTSRSGPGRIN